MRFVTAAGVLATAAAALVLSAAPASAHAELADTDPDAGAVLAQAPEVVRFTFTEPVQGVPDGVEVFDAEGNTVDSSSRTSDDQLLVTLEEDPGEGSLVVAWRVVSADGHPISGTLTFAVGAPSPEVDVPALRARVDEVATALSLSRWPAYAGLLLAVGLVWFATRLVPGDPDALAHTWRRLRSTAQAGAAVGSVAWLAGIPLTASYLRGGGSVLEGATWQALPADEAALAVITAAGLVTAAWLLPARPGRSTRHELAGLVGFLALAPLPLSGHTVAGHDAELVMAVDWLHLATGAVWLGGLCGLAITVPALGGRPEISSRMLSRFSTAAATVLALLVLTGALLAWRLVGSWQGLVDSGYGRLLLAKVALAAVAAGVAVYNRRRVLPRLEGTTGLHDRLALSRLLSRTATLEAGVLVAVVLVTSFLVQQSPPRAESTVPAADRTVRANLGDLTAVVTISPAVAGTNTVTLRLRDPDGEPVDGVETPRVRMTSGDLGGDVPLVRRGQGTFEGRVVVPREGLWEVQVSVRLSQFDNPVGSVSIQVG